MSKKKKKKPCSINLLKFSLTEASFNTNTPFWSVLVVWLPIVICTPLTTLPSVSFMIPEKLVVREVLKFCKAKSLSVIVYIGVFPFGLFDIPSSSEQESSATQKRNKKVSFFIVVSLFLNYSSKHKRLLLKKK